MQVLYRLSYVGSNGFSRQNFPGPILRTKNLAKLLERETGFEPATLSLEG